jgi:hypothetical protein
MIFTFYCIIEKFRFHKIENNLLYLKQYKFNSHDTHFYNLQYKIFDLVQKSLHTTRVQKNKCLDEAFKNLKYIHRVTPVSSRCLQGFCHGFCGYLRLAAYHPHISLYLILKSNLIPSCDEHFYVNGRFSHKTDFSAARRQIFFSA